MTPRIEIDLAKIEHNAKFLFQSFRKKGIEITAVVKGVSANYEIAKTIVESGITSLADSKIENIKKLKEMGLRATYMLLRTPALSEVNMVVKYADISLNTEFEVIKALSQEAIRQQKIHQIIIMVEMGDLREGVLPEDVPNFIRKILPLPGIKIVGIGANFACFGGVIPTEQEMNQFAQFVTSIQTEFSLKLPYISGGNSANYHWLMNTKNVGIINHLRLGEIILLGRETAYGKSVPELYKDAFYFVTEVIEANVKPSVPYGTIGTNAFGEAVTFKDRGKLRRAILNAGRQDVVVSGLSPEHPFEILGSSSDHIIIDAKNMSLKPGDEVRFSVDYGALISAMASPYVKKKYLKHKQNSPKLTSA